MPSSSDLYKIDNKKPKFAQFIRLINVELRSEAAIIWKMRLQEQTEKYLDLNKTTTQQKIPMLRIEKELEKIYPDAFDGANKANRLNGAMRAIVSIHNSRRSQMIIQKRRNEQDADKIFQDAKSFVDSNVIDLTLDNSDSEPAPRRMLRSFTKNKPRSPDFEMPEPKKNSSPVKTMGVLTERSPIKSISSKVKSEEREQEGSTQPHGNGMEFVFDFLSKCKPSMTYLLHVFLQHGCETEDHIRAVAKWRSKKREEWLTELLGRNAHSIVRRLTKADIQRLGEHFASYAV